MSKNGVSSGLRRGYGVVVAPRMGSQACPHAGDGSEPGGHPPHMGLRGSGHPEAFRPPGQQQEVCLVSVGAPVAPQLQAPRLSHGNW